MVYDRATRWKRAYPVPSKGGDQAYKDLQHFAGRTKVKQIWTDNSPELRYACDHLRWPHPTSTPGISQTNSSLSCKCKMSCKDGTRFSRRQAFRLASGVTRCLIAASGRTSPSMVNIQRLTALGVPLARGVHAPVHAVWCCRQLPSVKHYQDGR